MKVFLFILLIPSLAFAAPVPYRQIGKVVFGDGESERQASVVAVDTVVGSGAPGAKARYIAKEGELRFSLPVDPDKTTYLTLKMWGSDVAGVVPAENGPITLGVPRADLWVGGKPDDAQDFEVLTSKPNLPDRFFYRTIRLPLDLTKGKSSIDFSLKPLQIIVNSYAGAGPTAVIPAGSYTRGYYEAFTHVGNFFPDQARLANPEPAENPAQLPDLPLLEKRFNHEIDDAAQVLMSRQLYGPAFDEAAKRLNIPPSVHGLFDKDGLTNYLESSQKTGDWLTPTTGSGSGRLHAICGAIFMYCYGSPDSRFHQSPEMLDRTIASLDAFRRYQGENGAYEIGGGDFGWMGGPRRKPAAGGLQGFFIGDLARSFEAVWPYVKDRPDILDAKIDSDGDGNPDVTRRAAWTAIFHEYLKGQGKLPGGVANQARANAIGATLASQALQILNPGDNLGHEDMKTLVEQSIGLIPHPRAGGTWMLTRAGVSLEAGGFCPAYGQHANRQFADLIETYNDPRVKEQFAKELELFSYMVFPLNDDHGGPLLVSGPEGSRHRDFPGATLNWMALAPAATDMHDPFAGWAVSHELARVGLSQKPLFNDLQKSVHLASAVADTISFLNRLPELENAIATPAVLNYILPAAAPDWRNKNDEQVGLIMLHNKGQTLYIQAVNGGRYQFIAPAVQAFGNIDFEERDGVRTILYGPWLIAQNTTATFTAANDKGHDAAWSSLPAVPEARDEVSGKTMKLNKPIILPAYTTVIFDLAALGNPKVLDIGL